MKETRNTDGFTCPICGEVHLSLFTAMSHEKRCRREAAKKETHTPKFKPGDMVIARNGRGDVYMVNRIVPADRWAPARYEFDNGSVDIRKRAKSGMHDVTEADRDYKVTK